MPNLRRSLARFMLCDNQMTIIRDSWLRRTCLLKYTSRLHFAGGWITYQKDIVPV